MKIRKYLPAIGVSYLLFFVLAFVTGLYSPLGVIVKFQFGISMGAAQLGTLANFLAYAFMGIPSGIMLKRYGYKLSALAAATIGIIGVGLLLFSGYFEWLWMYYLGAFVAGFSMCMLNAVVNPMLNTLGGGGNRGNQLVQFGGACNSIAATLAPVLGGYLIGDIAGAKISNANPVFFLAMGIFALVFIVLSMVNIPEPYVVKEEKSATPDKHSALSFRHFVLGMICIFIYVGIEVGIPNIMNLFMTIEKGIDPAAAGSVVGTYWFLMLIGRLLGGIVGGKVSSKTMLSTVATLGLILVLSAIFVPTSNVSMPVLRGDLSFGMENVPVTCLLLVLCGLCTSVMWGGIFNLAVEGLGKYTSAASGLFMMMVCGGGILPAIQGALADSIGYINSYWLIVVCLGYLLFYALVGSKNVNKNIPVE